MTALTFPCTIFQTQNRMHDYRAKDMRCGDLSEAQLKKHYCPFDLSTRVNPYLFEKIISLIQPYSIFVVPHRFNQFSFKPLMKNIEATIEISGERNDAQK